MKISLDGKVALVSASTGGIGFAIAKGLAESGAEVILNGRSEDSVNKAKTALEKQVPGAKLRTAMVKKGWGRVVFISSESALNIPADMIHYGVTKTAQLSLARGLAKFVAGSGVTVNSVLPGPTMSDGFAGMMKEEMEKTGKSLETLAKEFVMANRPSSVIQRAATVEEVANMVVYVCSKQASATSGAALRVDGGVVDDIV